MLTRDLNDIIWVCVVSVIDNNFVVCRLLFRFEQTASLSEHFFLNIFKLIGIDTILLCVLILSVNKRKIFLEMTVSCALFTVCLKKDQWLKALVNFIWQHLIECFLKSLFATLSYWDHLVHLKIYSRDLPDFLRDLELGHWPDWVLIHCEYWTTFVATICMTSFCCYPLSHSCCQGSKKKHL